MSAETLRMRLSTLLRKSQKAISLYSASGVHSSSRDKLSNTDKRFSSPQVQIWKRVSENLAQDLHKILIGSDGIDSKRVGTGKLKPINGRKILQQSYELRDSLYSSWRKLQSEIHLKREELMQASEDDQFVRCVLLSERLVVLKARFQATRAALHEVEKALGGSSLKRSYKPTKHDDVDYINELADQVDPEELEKVRPQKDDKVIPFEPPKRNRG